MEYWSDLYLELGTRIHQNLPEIRWVDLWHDQVSYLTEEHPFPTPAVFLGFNTVGIDDKGIKVQECDTQVDMFLFYETFSDTYMGSINQSGAIDFLKQLTLLYALFHGKTGINHSEMRRVFLGREESGGSGNLYRVSFQCMVTDYAAKKLFIETINPLADLEIEKGNIPPILNDPGNLYL